MAGSQVNLAAAFKTGLSVMNASGGVSPGGRLVSLAVGLDGQPNAATDTQIIFSVLRLSAQGSANATTARALKDWWNSPASRNSCASNYGTEPTYVASSNLWLRQFNQRAAMQWAGQDIDAYPEWASIQAGTAGSIPNGLGILGSGGSTPVTVPGGFSGDFDE